MIVCYVCMCAQSANSDITSTQHQAILQPYVLYSACQHSIFNYIFKLKSGDFLKASWWRVRDRQAVCSSSITHTSEPGTMQDFAPKVSSLHSGSLPSTSQAHSSGVFEIFMYRLLSYAGKVMCSLSISEMKWYPLLVKKIC